VTLRQAQGDNALIKKVAILGSTGSIGTQALEVIAAHPDRFKVVGLAAARHAQELVTQAERFQPDVLSIGDDYVPQLREALGDRTRIVGGADGLLAVALESGADILLAATDGFAAFEAVFAAAKRGTDLAIANKELIVAAGELLMNTARAGGARVIPVDSEHSAIFQCLVGEDRSTVDALILTASGGPFWRKTAAELASVSLEEALAHPTWQMGVKNTIDSSTLMNKGLEVIEAAQLFAIPPDRIQIAVHPQSIAHGAVIFTDGSVKMQLAPPDMRLPIGYALSYPDRLDETTASRDAMVALGGRPEGPQLRYEFERPDSVRFPCLTLAYEAALRGKTAPAVLSAANEIAVAAFVKGEIGFSSIPAVIERAMGSVPLEDVSPAAVRAADAKARDAARTAVQALFEKIEV